MITKRNIAFLSLVFILGFVFALAQSSLASFQCCKNIPGRCGGGQNCITCQDTETCGGNSDVCYYHSFSSQDDGLGFSDPVCNPGGSPLSCTPATQTIDVNTSAGFDASGGTSPYAWDAGPADSPNPKTGSGAFFQTSYSSVGTYTVTVTDNVGAKKGCTVTVTAAPPPPPPSAIDASFDPSISAYTASAIGALNVPTVSLFYTRNTGLAGNLITWQCKLHTGYTPPPGLTINLGNCIDPASPNPIDGGSPPFP